MRFWNGIIKPPGQQPVPSKTIAKVLVTGATGFLGLQVVDALRQQKLTVRALVRPTSDVSALRQRQVELVVGDVTEPGSLPAALAGQDAVVHAAGMVSDWGQRQAFFRVNSQGTQNVCAACQAAGVRRLVHVSSLTVLGLSRRRETLTELTPVAAAPPDAYTASKIQGEREVRRAHGQGGLDTVVVRPGVIWGRGDPTITPRIVRLLRRRLMVYIDGGRNSVALSHVENLAWGIALALTSPRAPGQVYHVLDQEEITAGQVIDALARAVGVPPPRISLPFAVVHGVASGLEVVARLSRSPHPPLLTRYGVRLVASDCRYDRSKAQRELGYEPRVSFNQGMAALS